MYIIINAIHNNIPVIQTPRLNIIKKPTLYFVTELASQVALTTAKIPQYCSLLMSG